MSTLYKDDRENFLVNTGILSTWEKQPCNNSTEFLDLLIFLQYIEETPERMSVNISTIYNEDGECDLEVESPLIMSDYSYRSF